MKVQYILFFLFLCFSIIGKAINFSQVNIAWQYDINAPLQFSHRVISENKKISVFLRIRTDSLYKWNYDFLVQDGYETENHKEITPIKIDTLLDVKGHVVVRLDIIREVPDILVIQISRSEEYYYYDIGLKIGKLSFPSIYPIDEEGLPIFENFINRSGFKWMNNHSFYAMKYEDSAGPADPPMADMKPLAPRADLDTSFLFTDFIEFEENHFYTVRKDSLASTGVTVLRTPPYYPEYRKLTELVESMLYLTSEVEMKSLLNSKDLKKSFDSFWINNFNTKPRARNAIRTYYNDVEEANKLFTDFKAGWKTDRGMILIVFGKPNEVYRTNSLEEWYYDSGELFEFTIISSFFSSRTYTLRRNKAMEENWYRKIASIRKGINE